MLRGIIIAVLSLGSCSAAERFTTLKLNTEAYGMIVGTNGAIAGTGFIVGSPGRVLTCDHVVAPQPALDYHFVNAVGSHLPVTIEKTLRKYDIAVLRLDSSNSIQPLPYGDIRRIRPGDDVIYVGYNANDRALKVSKAEVSAIGVVLHQGVSVDFIEFEGEGIPGYSGGPIMNYKGEVIALMSQAWNRRGIRGGNDVLVNRGFAIEPAMLSQEIFYPTKPLLSTNALGTNTISIRLDLK